MVDVVSGNLERYEVPPPVPPPPEPAVELVVVPLVLDVVVAPPVPVVGFPEELVVDAPSPEVVELELVPEVVPAPVPVALDPLLPHAAALETTVRNAKDKRRARSMSPLSRKSGVSG
jgi:hypothetical protein